MVEVLISTLIFSVGFISVANLMLSNLKTSADSRNAIIGAQLAQEGAELVRNFRDNNIAFSRLAFAGMDSTGNTAVCPLVGSSVMGAGFTVANNGCNPVAPFLAGQLFVGASGYNYTRGPGGDDPETPFLRKVFIYKDLPVVNKYTVESIVLWGATDFANYSGANIANCNSVSKCTFVRLVLNDSGWK